MNELVEKHKRKIGLVFIHGAGYESKIWDNVVSHLKNPFLLVDFPQRQGENRLRQKLTLQDYTTYMKKQIDSWEIDHFVIVAHSLGGVLSLQIANDLSDRLVGFVAIGATIPKQGGSFLSVLPIPKKILVSAVLRVFGTKPPETVIRSGLCNDLSPEQTTEVIQGYIAESINIYTSQIKALAPNVPKLYIKLSKDKELSLSQQEKMISNLNPQKVETLEAGHLPMLSKPIEVRNSLIRFITQLEAE